MLEQCLYLFKNRCPEDKWGFSPGFFGERANKTKLMVVGNRADIRVREKAQADLFVPKPNDHKEAMRKSRTGMILGKMLRYSGLDYEDIYFTNVFKCLLIEDRDPTPEQYRQCEFNLMKQVRAFQPKGILVLGHQAYGAMFPIEARTESLEEWTGREKTYKDRPCLILNHPCKMMNTMSPEKRQAIYQDVKEFLQKYNIIGKS